MTKVKSIYIRHRLIGGTLMISLLAVGIWHLNSRPTPAQGGFASAIFTVTPNSNKPFLPTSTTPGTSFQVEGSITAVNERGQVLPGNDADKKVGDFYRTGVVLDSGFSLVTDVYVLDKFNGAITATGVLRGAVFADLENADLLVVTGGVGTFRSAAGEAQVTITDSTTGKFTVRLEEGRRR